MLSPFFSKFEIMKPMNDQEKDLQKVIAQIDASNAGDIEGCLAYWAEDLKVIELPKNEVVFSNKQQVREHLQKEFESGASPKVKVLESKVDGSKIHVIEEKTRFGKSIGKMKFSYFVEGGVITTMWAYRDL